jgi:hypothetical protein
LTVAIGRERRGYDPASARPRARLEKWKPRRARRVGSRIVKPPTAALSFLLAACASARSSLDPLPGRPVDSVAGEAVVGGAALEPRELGDTSAPGAGSLPAFRVEGRFLRLSSRDARALLGGSPGQAIVSPRAGAERALGELEARARASRLASSSLVLRPGRPDSISTMNPTSFVERYELAAQGTSLVADPVIGVVGEGALLAARIDVRDDAQQLDLSLELSLCDLQRPIPEVQARLPGTRAPVTIQRPIASLQRLEAHARLARDECVVLRMACAPAGLAPGARPGRARLGRGRGLSAAVGARRR